MKILIIGSGGREHAIAWKIGKNPLVEKIFCAPGNGCTALENKCENIKISSNEELLEFALKNNVHLTIVGPEVPLMDGIVDLFKDKGLNIFGPDKKAALLEGSKAFAKDFMKKYNIKTAAYEVFEEEEKALEYLKNSEHPVVIKADGLAAGKGVVISNSFEESKNTLEEFMTKDKFNGAGKRVVIEEFLEGPEASILSITDGETIIPFISSKDHKQIYDGGLGSNTGGMGVISPNPYCTEEVLKDFDKNILKPTLKGLQEENLKFSGIIFFGIMITKKGPYLLEYNLRMGDPETEAVLPLMESDLLDLILISINKELKNANIKWEKAYSTCVIAASKGYPGNYKKGFLINGIENLEGIFGAGVKLENNKLLTNGGRVLCTQALGETLEESIKKAYDKMKKIDFEGIYYRKDIGK
ncbi:MULTISPECIES: phosphoribosylamine--glycine ligase [Clostridium]|uniref:Phosphoribosylamine--glycine ligase n=2 Tax=Clostridium sporogenes TaxID=1509 RepID=A0A7X5SWY7_CLOSG|nr:MULTISPECIES: phosphoribosylamine--glycine ligase [Clostridium]AJD33034.1 phosphoribosylamine--glycine ligase [Clostridium botulinum Prevot_594]STC82760.1 phosphoribosylamine--glycine ligase [Clostridium botulinum]AKC63666.1 phosphoribosylamine--glycine ligase PurD [Clostridium sporogenes]AKJ90821.1 phosphoribosylamine--glycine ligase [Clostridium sporogenes]KCZ67364.1 phosphoribosylamine--glycine ligase PurD [Clostridium sporogenes]